MSKYTLNNLQDLCKVMIKDIKNQKTYLNKLENENIYLQNEKQQLKERVAYLERSNDRKEETIIDLRMEQELDVYKSVLNEVREYVYKSKVIVPMEYAINVGLFKKKIVEILDKVGDK